MTTQVWIDGEKIRYTSAYVVIFDELGGPSIQTCLTPDTQDSIRIKLVEDGDIIAECPITFERLGKIAREG